MTHADSIWAKALELHSDSLQSKVNSLQAKFDSIQAKNDLLYSIVETANDGVNNQLSAANYLLALVAVVIAIVAIWLSIYIGNKKKEIESMAKTIDETKDTVTKIAKNTEVLDKKIHCNLSDLYKDLRKEETNALLDRLLLEPKDVNNLNTILWSREIEESGYAKLREAYIKLKNEERGRNSEFVTNNYLEEYLVLFYQHFFYHAINDGEISPEFDRVYGSIFARAYKRDMIKSTIDLCKALSDENSTFKKEEVLTLYLKALNSSKYKDLEDLKNIFEQNITPSSLLQKAIARCTADHVYLQLFGITPPEGEESTK